MIVQVGCCAVRDSARKFNANRYSQVLDYGASYQLNEVASVLDYLELPSIGRHAGVTTAKGEMR